MRNPDHFKLKISQKGFDQSPKLVCLYGFDKLNCSIKELTLHSRELIDADFF